MLRPAAACLGRVNLGEVFGKSTGCAKLAACVEEPLDEVQAGWELTRAGKWCEPG